MLGGRTGRLSLSESREESGGRRARGEGGAVFSCGRGGGHFVGVAAGRLRLKERRAPRRSAKRRRRFRGRD